MPESKTIELYRILKSTNPNGDFSDYEAVIRQNEYERLSKCISSLRLPAMQVDKFIFFEPKTKDVFKLHSETEEYIAALQELEQECSNCIARNVDIGNLSIFDIVERGKVNLSSTRNVNLAIERLRTSKGASGDGTYFQSSFPLLIFTNPALNTDNRAYSKEFNKQLDDYIAAQTVKSVDVESYFQTNNYTFVSKNTIGYVVAEANKELTATIEKYTRMCNRRLAWSILWRIILLFAALAIPTLVLSLSDMRLKIFDWYWWIVYILAGLAAGIVPPFIFYSLNTKAYRIKGKIEIRMFMMPFLISCVLLAGVMTVVAIHNGLLSIVFAVIYFVLYVVGTVVRSNGNKGSDCNIDNTWGLKTVLSGLCVALLSFDIGNLLLDNRAAYLTVNILAVLACASTLVAGKTFIDCVDSLEGEFSTVMAYLLPIAAFLIGQVVQCSMYDAEYDVWIIGDIFGHIPLLFMVLSSVCCAMCTALVIINSVFLVGNDKPVRGWIFNVVCSACYLLIPCFAGAVGIVALPIVTFILARVYYDGEDSFLPLGYVSLILFYVLGQFVQYYFYVTDSSTLAVAALLARIPLWLQIISTIAGAVAVGLSIYCYNDGYPDEGVLCLVFVPSILLGVLPAVMSIPLVAVMSILAWQFANSTDEQYMPIVPIITAFGIGQTFLWWNYTETERVVLLSDLVAAFGVAEPIGLVLPIISSVFGTAACILTIVTTYRFFENDHILRGLWIMIPFAVLMMISPALASIPLFVVVLLVMILYNREMESKNNYYGSNKKKPVRWSLYVGISVVIGLQALLFAISYIDFSHIGQYSADGVYYVKQGENYYVSDCDDDKELLVIPKTIKGIEVAGVTDEFEQKHPGIIYNLNYEHADANDSAGKVIVLNSATEQKFPIPQREGYTFYGWWSSPNRDKGRQITAGNGELTPNTLVSSNLYAMWYGSEYNFIYSLDAIENNLYGKYVLADDVVIEGNYTPICGLSGMETQLYRQSFSGVLDGNYHTVKYSITGSRRYNGLFSWIGPDGTVKNLGVDVKIDVDFESYSTEYYAFAGGIAAINDGVIRNCWSTGSIKLRNKISVAFAAGIAGASGTNNMRSGAIIGCYNLASIESSADDSYAAGILGSAENDGQTVSYCYNRGTIKATGVNSNNTAAGGIISHGRTHAENSYNAGAILTDYHNKQTLGGILGFIRNTYAHNCPPANCAWLKAENCQAEWGVGKYSNDETGGNNGGVTVVSKEDNVLVNLLNADEKHFTLSNGELHLAWERHLRD